MTAKTHCRSGRSCRLVTASCKRLYPPSRDVSSYPAVIICGAPYASRWHRYARRFTKRYRRQLRHRPAYLFSSGPLDNSALERDIPPVKGAAALMKQVGARGHATFGGRLLPEPPSFWPGPWPRSRRATGGIRCACESGYARSHPISELTQMVLPRPNQLARNSRPAEPVISPGPSS
jgi:Flavodoxin domain